MKKLLAVYNTCGISGHENVNYYIRAIDSILAALPEDYDLVISACMAAESTKEILKSLYTGKAYFNFIDEVLPVNVTFNHSVLKMVGVNGQYEGYLYIDSGVHFEGQPDSISKLYKVFKSGQYGMVAARTDTDTGADLWFGKGNDSELFGETDRFIIPVGKATNLHVQIFSNELFKAYDRLMPDIFASYCTESTFSFLCAALKLRWIIYKDLVLIHAPMMDGQSAGFSPRKWAAEGNRLIDHPFRVGSVLPLVQGGQRYGLGYEEIQGVVMHDESQYENGFCTNPFLKEYIYSNLFLPQELLDYTTIKHEYIGKELQKWPD